MNSRSRIFADAPVAAGSMSSGLSLLVGSACGSTTAILTPLMLLLTQLILMTYQTQLSCTDDVVIGKYVCRLCNTIIQTRGSATGWQSVNHCELAHEKCIKNRSRALNKAIESHGTDVDSLPVVSDAVVAASPPPAVAAAVPSASVQPAMLPPVKAVPDADELSLQPLAASPVASATSSVSAATISPEISST